MPAFSGFGMSAVAGRIMALGNVQKPSVLRGLSLTLPVVVAAAFMMVVPIVASAPIDDLVRTARSLTLTQPSDVSAEGGNEQVKTGAYRNLSETLTTPRYLVQIPTGMFPEGYDWEFTAGGSAPCPAGATDVLRVTDRASGELAFIVYGFPYADLYADPAATVAPYAMEGFCQFVVARPATDSAAVVLAMPADRDPELAQRCPESLGGIVLGGGAEGSLNVNSDILRDGLVARLCPSFGSHGLRNEVWGLADDDMDPAAYLARASVGERGTTVETTAFSLEIPAGMYVADYGYSGFFYKDWDLLAPERRAALCFELPDGNDVSVYCRPAGLVPERDELWSQTHVELVCEDVPAPDGYEIVVEGQTYFANALGELPTNPDQAEADLQAVAGWLVR